MLKLVNICKDYIIDKNKFHALKNVNLFFGKHEFTSILGPSGCGKTTLLNIIGGLDKYTSGDLIIDNKSTKIYRDKDWDNYRNKRIGFVFQSYNLISHLSILANVEMALILNGVSKKERTEKAKEALDKVGLKGLYHKKQNQLSGGQIQRVAIARALVNDPEIILADEPTGALDSKTSIQVMELLKEISKTKLVIMVTHNEELAYEYSDRVLKIKDGEIQEDIKLHPENCESEEKTHLELTLINEKDKKVKRSKKLSKMGFFTALKISIKNLITKKGRTILTSIASSFGIIGVALVLALSNGFEGYVDRIQKETASSSPITYNSLTITYNSESSNEINQTESFPKDDEIYPFVDRNVTKTIHYNEFTPKFIKFLELLKNKDELISSYLINYAKGYGYNLYTKTPDSIDGNTKSQIHQINTSRSISTTSSLVNQVTGLPNTIFHEFFGDEKYTTELYEVIEGSFPKNMNEIALVVDNYNRVHFNVLKELGFYNEAELEENVRNERGKSTKVKPISFEDIIGKEYKIVPYNEAYTKAKDKIVVDGEGNSRTITQYNPVSVTEEKYNDDNFGMNLKITGILRAKPSTIVSLMDSSLCYTKALNDYLIPFNKNSEVAQTLKNNIYLRKDATLDDFMNELKSIVADGAINIDKANEVYQKYFVYEHFLTTTNPANYRLKDYINDSRTLALDLIPSELKKDNFHLTLFNYFQKAIDKIQNNLSTPEIIQSGYDDLMGFFAYLNTYTDVTSIIVFPKSITTKEALIKKLDAWNIVNIYDPLDPYHASTTSEQTEYMDVVGDVTKGIGEMINIISVVLIIFASISLCVSCVMTGIITYTSVIERTKEIGVLRALGARKHDVGKLFEAETVIIGALAGIIGCLFAVLISFPINGILNIYYGQYNIGNICSLNPYHALLLIAISIALTFISSLIPARTAAKKDPVVALRTE